MDKHLKGHNLEPDGNCFECHWCERYFISLENVEELDDCQTIQVRDGRPIIRRPESV